eukprot:m.28652 g.28652  ORF g.28652 m.28652 type:complete len:696 (+) comp14183_c0_seq2:90-2177(+)
MRVTQDAVLSEDIKLVPISSPVAENLDDEGQLDEFDDTNLDPLASDQSPASTQSQTFFAACKTANVEIVTEMLDRGFDPLSKNEFLQTPLHVVTQGDPAHRILGKVETEEIIQARLRVTSLLLERGVAVNELDRGRNALTTAMLEGRSYLCPILLQGGSDPVIALRVFGNRLEGLKMHLIERLCQPDIFCACPNPIGAAFHLADELLRMARKDKGRAYQYHAVYDTCVKFALELLGHLESEWEVRTLLKDSTGVLKHAIKLKQKEFIAHPYTQEHLTELWLNDFVSTEGTFEWFILFLKYFFWPVVLPFTFFSVILSGESMRFSSFGRFVDLCHTPYMKFVGNSLAFVGFLALMLVVASQDSTKTPSAAEAVLFVWVVGLLVTELREMWQVSFRLYWENMWNWLDIALLGNFFVIILIRLTVWQADVDNEEDVLQAANILLALNAVTASIRLLNVLQTHNLLGPLLITVGYIMVDLMMFLVILVVFILAFSMGIAKVYQQNIAPGDEGPDSALGNVAKSMRTLFWALFGFIELDDFNVSGPLDSSTQVVGEILFGAYMVLVFILALNLLIAMINNSYQRVHDNSDVEWKFGRARLIREFQQHPVIPSPFNLVVEPISFIFKLFRFRDRAIQTSTDMEEETFQLHKLMTTVVKRYKQNKPKKELDSPADLTATAELRSEIRELRSLVQSLLNQQQQ